MEATQLRCGSTSCWPCSSAGSTRGLRASIGVDRPTIVVLLDGAAALRRQPGVARLLAEGPAVGIRALCIEGDRVALPVECRATAETTGPVGTRLRFVGPDTTTYDDVVADGVSDRWARRFARAVAPLRDATPDDRDSTLPRSVRLLDLVPFDATDPAALETAWRVSPRDTRVPLGVGTDGEPFVVDLAADGPHVLVAGTTGAGKSELLQTLVAGLAVGNRPDEMSFVLIDYKGGAAFRDCAELPHTVGMVTDLDGHLTERALAIPGAELRRREAVLAGAGCTDLDEYIALGIAHGGRAGSPRPGGGRVRDAGGGAARLRGRSGGDRPTGPLARSASGARHPTPGRRRERRHPCQHESPDRATGHATRPSRPTSSTSGTQPTSPPTCRDGRCCGSGPGRSAPCRPPGWVARRPARRRCRCGRLRGSGWVTRPTVVEAPVAAGPTDLTRLVRACRAAAAALGSPPVASPWLPPLPDVVAVDDLAGLTVPPARGAARAGRPAVRTAPGRGHLRPRRGRPPARRRERPKRQDDDAAHPRGGAGGAVRCHRPAPLRVSTGPVEVWQPWPRSRTAARWWGGTRPRGASACWPGSPGELERRQRLLAKGGLGSHLEQRRAAPIDERLPWMVLLVDGWEGLVAAYESVDHGRPLDNLLRLVREGAAVGLRVVMTGDRAALTSRAGSAFRDRLVLRLADPADYALAGISPRQVPDAMPAGRALVWPAVQEAQLAVLDVAATGAGQGRALAAVAGRAAARQPASQPHAGFLPMRVEPLPARLEVDEVEAAAKAASTGPGWALVGVGGDELRPCGVDLDTDGPAFVIAGPAGSGRSTALATMGRWLLGQGRRAVVIAHRRSPLRALGDDPGVLAVLGSDDAERARRPPRRAPGPGRARRRRGDLARHRRGTTAARAAARRRRGRSGRAAGRVRRRDVGLLPRAHGRGPAAPDRAVAGSDGAGRRRPARRAAAQVRRGSPGRGVLVVRGRLAPVQVATRRSDLRQRSGVWSVAGCRILDAG